MIGPEFNGECLGMWWHRMVTPFVVKGATSPQEINQSFPGVLSRLLTDLTPGHGPLRHSPRPEPDVSAPLDGQLPDQGRRALPPGAAGVPVPDQDDGPARSAAARRSRPGGSDDAFRLGAELEAPLRYGAAAVQLSGVRNSFRRVSARDLECCLSARGRCHLS